MILKGFVKLGDQKAKFSSAVLVGNSMVSEPTIGRHQWIDGFVINNPNGLNVQVDLQHYFLNEASSEDNKRLKQNIYDTYKLASQSVPAFTPLIECVAQSSQYILHSEASKAEGVFSNLIYLKNPLKTADNNLTEHLVVVNIAGNPNLPDREIPIEIDTDKSHIKTIAKIEQQNKYYLGRDGLWYATNPLETVMHEIAHACKDLQNLTAEGDMAYETSKKQGITPEDEKRVIEFVNKVLIESRGMPGRDLNSDTAQKPNNAPLGKYIPLDEHGLEKLKRGPIPNELKQYSHPELIDLQGRSNNQSNNVFPKLAHLFNRNLMTKLQNELVDFNHAHQKQLISNRINEIVLNNNKAQETSILLSELAF